jgi:GT2 family glycosyltransferase
MESTIKRLPVEISISELDEKITITLGNPRKKENSAPPANLCFQYSLFNIEVPKNLKKYANLKEITYYIERTSLDLTNPLHLSWLCFIFVKIMQKESKIIISGIKFNISNPIVSYYILKNYNLNQIESKIQIYNLNKMTDYIHKELLLDINYDKKAFLDRSLLSETKQLLLQLKKDKASKVIVKEELPDFSLVIPTLAKNLHFLEDCLKSVYDSKKRPTEIILVVPNETEFRKRFSFLNFRSIPLRVVEGNKNGIGLARLKGSKAAKFDYVAFVDDDDVVRDDFFLQLLIALSSSNKIAAIGCWLQSFGFANHVLPQFDNLPCIGLVNCSPSAGILMWQKKDLVSLGGHDPEFEFGYEDFDLTVRALAAGKTIRVVDVPMYFYRRHTGSTTMNYTQTLEQGYKFKIMQKTLKSNPEFSQELSKILFVNNGDIKDQSPFYWKALRKSPKTPKTPKKKFLLIVYHSLPLKLRRKIYNFLRDL